MSRPTRRKTQDNAQLGLPLPKPKVSLSRSQSEPIAVRIPEAVRLTGLGRSKLYELIAAGDVEVVKIGRCTLIPMASLYSLFERARKGDL